MSIKERIAGLFATKAEPKQEQPPYGEVAFADPTRLYPDPTGQFWGQYNPSELVTRKGLTLFDEMRRDEQIKAALKFKKGAVVATGWEIVSPDDKSEDWEIREFVQWNLDHLERGLDRALKLILSAHDYGYSVNEKVWAEPGPTDWGQRVTLKAIKNRRPHEFDLRSDAHGNLDGVLQYQPKGNKTMPPAKFIIHAHDMEWGNWYGTSDLEACYRPWWVKKNAYRWFAMLLERFGIPPVFGLYDPSKYTPSQIDELKTVFSRLQAMTSGLIPRPAKKGDQKGESMDFWSPELVKQSQEAFVAALKHFDGDIARALLMPGLMGLTPDEGVGSQARSQVHFDVFLLVIDEIREELRGIVQEQIIEPLVDFNWETDQYPRFQFKPLTDERRLDLLEQWTKLVEKGAVRSTKDDEDHMRNVLDFPTRDEDAEPVTLEPGDEEEEEEEEEEEDDDDDKIPKAKPNAASAVAGYPGEGDLGRDPSGDSPVLQLTQTDFKAIEQDLDRVEDEHRPKLRAALMKTRDVLIKDVKKRFKK